MATQYVQMTLNDWMELKGKLEAELRGAAASFVRIGYWLRRIDETQGYRNDGSESLSEWAKDNYGLSKTQVSRFMAINRKYSIDGYNEHLRMEFARYGSAKLSEMLSLPDADLEMVSPEMKREDIRELKKLNKEAAEEARSTEEQQAEVHPVDVQQETTEEAAGPVGADTEDKVMVEMVPPKMLPEHAWIYEFFKDNEDVMNELFASDAYKTGNVDGMKEIVNPSGARTYRHKTTVVSMLESRIMVKVFPKAAAPMSWDGFIRIADDLFGAYAGDGEIYKTVFGQKAEPVKEQRTEEKQVERKPEKEASTKLPKPTEPDLTVAPAQQEKPVTVEPETKQEVEQVEIEEIMPAPTEPDPMRDLKDRFLAEINSLRILLESDSFVSMQQNIERLEHLRIKMMEVVDGTRIL